MQIKPATARMMGYTGSVERAVRPRDQHQVRHEVSRHGASARRRHNLRHDPAIQCRPWRQAHEPGVGGLLQQGEACRWPRLGHLRDSARRKLVFRLRFRARTPLYARQPAGRPHPQSRKAAGEESPGSMETRCRITSGGGDPRESATESKPPGFRCRKATGRARVKGWGKSPPRDWQQERHGKPHREQDRIGAVRGATLRAVSGSPSG